MKRTMQIISWARDEAYLKAKKSLLCWMLIPKISPYHSSFEKSWLAMAHEERCPCLDVQNFNHSTYSYFLCQLLYLYYLSLLFLTFNLKTNMGYTRTVELNSWRASIYNSAIIQEYHMAINQGPIIWCSKRTCFSPILLQSVGLSSRSVNLSWDSWFSDWVRPALCLICKGNAWLRAKP